MKIDYTRKAILTLLTMALLCQTFSTYLFKEDVTNFTSIELDVDHENESENNQEEQKKELEEDKKDKTYPKDSRLQLSRLSTKNHHYFKQNKRTYCIVEIVLPPPRMV